MRHGIMKNAKIQPFLKYIKLPNKGRRFEGKEFFSKIFKKNMKLFTFILDVSLFYGPVKEEVY